MNPLWMFQLDGHLFSKVKPLDFSPKVPFLGSPKNPFVCPKNPGFSRSIPILFGWDWNPKHPIRSGGVGILWEG